MLPSTVDGSRSARLAAMLSASTLCIATLLAPTAWSDSKVIHVPNEAKFRDPLMISRAVIADCDLPPKQMQFLVEAAAKAGVEIVQGEAPATGRYLSIEIVRADSMRMGRKHVKQMAVAGKLFENGEEIASFVAQRRSGGGVLGDFMTSCAVLHKCAERIARDAAKWMLNPTLNAQLGEGRHRLDIAE